MKFFEEFTKSQKRTILLAALMASLLVAFTAIKDRDVVDHKIAIQGQNPMKAMSL